MNLASGADGRLAFDVHAGMDDRVGADGDVGLDPGGRRIDNGDAAGTGLELFASAVTDIGVPDDPDPRHRQADDDPDEAAEYHLRHPHRPMLEANSRRS